MCGSDICLGILAIVFPPIAVWVKKGLCSADSLINLALCCLGFLPGLLHAWYIIATSPDPTYDELSQDPEAQNGHVQYQYISQGPPPQRAPKGPQRGYGAISSSAPSSQFPVAQDQGFVQPAPNSQAGPSTGGGEETPPSYQQAVGDHKIQGP